jgi:hypothetical protein
MRYPTGMGFNTGHHYHNVAAQMNAYVNHPVQHNHHSFQGYFPQQVGASQFLQYGAQQIGVNPMVVNQLGGFARGFMHNILS